MLGASKDQIDSKVEGDFLCSMHSKSFHTFIDYGGIPTSL